MLGCHSEQALYWSNLCAKARGREVTGLAEQIRRKTWLHVSVWNWRWRPQQIG